MGAKAMARRLRPDVMIVVDVDFASDDPGVDPKKLAGEVKLGGGPVIHRGAGSNLALVDYACQVAADEGIPVQIKAIGGRTSTDAEELMSAGATATLSFSIPLRYMHSSMEVIQPDDAEAGRRARGRAGPPSRRGLDARALRAPRVAEASVERATGAGLPGSRPLAVLTPATATMPSARRSAAASRRLRAAPRRAPGGTGSAASRRRSICSARLAAISARRRPAATGHSEKLRLSRPSSTSRVDQPRGGRDVRVPRPDRLVAVAVEAGLLARASASAASPTPAPRSPAGSCGPSRRARTGWPRTRRPAPTTTHRTILTPRLMPLLPPLATSSTWSLSHAARPIGIPLTPWAGELTQCPGPWRRTERAMVALTDGTSQRAPSSRARALAARPGHRPQQEVDLAGGHAPPVAGVVAALRGSRPRAAGPRRLS